MFVIAESDTTVVRLDQRFDVARARSLADVLALFRPVPNVVIDFRLVRDVDAAALSELAQSIAAVPESRVTFRGLSRHLRRLLRYLGLGDGSEGAAEGRGRSTEPARPEPVQGRAAGAPPGALAPAAPGSAVA